MAARFGLGGTAFALEQESDRLIALHGGFGPEDGCYRESHFNYVRQRHECSIPDYDSVQAEVVAYRPDLSDPDRWRELTKNLRRAGLSADELKLAAARIDCNGRTVPCRKLAAKFGGTASTIRRRLRTINAKLKSTLPKPIPLRRDPYISVLIEVFGWWLVNWVYDL